MYFCDRASSITLAFPNCSIIFLIASPSDNANATFFIITQSGNYITQVPLSFSIMVVLSEWLEEKSIAFSFALNISPKTFKRYVDDSHTRFENKQKPP